jgi:hypothetical protein
MIVPLRAVDEWGWGQSFVGTISRSADCSSARKYVVLYDKW